MRNQGTKSPIPMTEKKRWQALWHRLGGQANAEAHFTDLLARHSEPQRAYHTFDHIKDCLAQFDQVRHQATRPDEVELALWLHDVIYDPHSSDNEEKSAQWAVEIMQQGRFPPSVISRVVELILATQHTSLPEEPDAQLVVDIDLSILGRPPDVFETYEDNVRFEYQWVPEAVYRQKRAQILDAFLARQSIYQTTYFKRRYEAQARANLRWSLARLRL